MLRRYLLEQLSEEEAERIDELSIADDEVAWRLRSVENDLVDAYVNGTLDAETRARFEDVYLSSAQRREKVRFAESLLQTVDRVAVAATEIPRSGASHAPALQSSGRTAVSQWSAAWVWSAMSVAAVLLIMCTSLLWQQASLQQELRSLQAERAALDSRTQALERQLSDQRSAAAQTAKELEQARASLAESSSARPGGTGTGGGSSSRIGLGTLALVLMPQTRATGTIASLAIPAAASAGAARVNVQLQLEFNDFPGYQVVLKEAGTSRSIWRSTRLGAKTQNGKPTLSVLVPANVLTPQHYSLEVTGLPANGGAEVVGSYAFKVSP